ncbi:helix-turn-helix domain-containing protein [Paraherbaspirillum soli]|uniref:Helix-turn-helix domain-containing protein n=1 Tax=Paraherbaspirillum soli TaxID=631222 RepID=A0ABW0M4S3_9BURK
MDTIGGRLKQERERLGKTQVEMGAIAGVTKGSQINYEGDKRVPDASYLKAIAAVGANVQYIISGDKKADENPSVEEIRKAAEAAFLMVTTSGISVTPQQFSQMVVAMLPSITEKLKSN